MTVSFLRLNVYYRKKYHQIINIHLCCLIFVLTDRVQTGDNLQVIYCNYKLVLLEKSLKLNFIFAIKNVLSKHIEPITFFFHHLSYDSQRYTKQGASNVTIKNVLNFFTGQFQVN